MPAPDSLHLYRDAAGDWRPTDGRAPRGALLGMGVFTTALVANGHVQYLSRHLARLRDSATTVGLPLVLAEAEVADVVADHCTDSPRHRLRIRVIETSFGTPRVSIELSVEPEAEPRPLTLTADTENRRYSGSLTSRHKTLSYTENVLASRRAKQAGFDDVLLLNERHELACAGFGNVFALLGFMWFTPRVEDGCMPGIIRAQLLERLEDITGYPVDDKPINHRYELPGATAVLYTNSIQGARLVSRIDDFRMPPLFDETTLQLLRQTAIEPG